MRIFAIATRFKTTPSIAFCTYYTTLQNKTSCDLRNHSAFSNFSHPYKDNRGHVLKPGPFSDLESQLNQHLDGGLKKTRTLLRRSPDRSSVNIILNLIGLSFFNSCLNDKRRACTRKSFLRFSPFDGCE
jgi:hypothetical protein